MILSLASQYLSTKSIANTAGQIHNVRGVHDIQTTAEHTTGATQYCTMCGLPGELSEELVTQEKRKKGWGMNCDVGETTEGLENEL